MKPKIVLVSCIATLLMSACTQDSPVLESQSRVERQQISGQISLPESGRQPVDSAAHPAEEVVIGSGQVLQDELISGTTGYADAKRLKSSAEDLQFFVPTESFRPASAGVNREQYAQIAANPVKLVREHPVSTFSIDVDTGAYAIVRRHLNQGQLPPTDVIRTEELINYFDYQYPNPVDRNAPFSISTEVATSPWNANRHLVQIGLQGYLPDRERPAANLVFLIDVSGSMNSPDKLPLLKNAFRLLTRQLDGQDKVTLVVYAGASGVVLEPTGGDQDATIMAALDRLTAGGSTHGSAGIQLAYAKAQQSFIRNGINRVILATDGDFNVGTVNHEALLDLIEEKKDHGIALTTLGFGSGNYNDHLMEQLADHGDGNYAYIDNLHEAKKVLVEQIDATLDTIARDVKIQVEWNPAQVAEYRLIGYENRVLNREDFNNDKVDAGDIGAGHRVTALYEITLVNSEQPQIEPLRYQSGETSSDSTLQGELAHVRLRYKQPMASHSDLIEQPLYANQIKSSIARASRSLQFASAVAAWGELLRGGEKINDFGYQDVLRLARQARGQDTEGYRGEFIKLVELSKMLDS